MPNTDIERPPYRTPPLERRIDDLVHRMDDHERRIIRLEKVQGTSKAVSWLAAVGLLLIGAALTMLFLIYGAGHLSIGNVGWAALFYSGSYAAVGAVAGVITEVRVRMINSRNTDSPLALLTFFFWPVMIPIVGVYWLGEIFFDKLIKKRN